jgi:hypothetical protein
MFLKVELLQSSDEGKETPTLLGPSERANLNHRTWLEAAEWVSHSPQLRTETDLASERYRQSPETQ